MTVAKRHGFNVNLLFDWRRKFRQQDGEPGSSAFVSVVVAPPSQVLLEDGVWEASPSDGRRLCWAVARG